MRPARCPPLPGSLTLWVDSSLFCAPAALPGLGSEPGSAVAFTGLAGMPGHRDPPAWAGVTTVTGMGAEHGGRLGVSQASAPLGGWEPPGTDRGHAGQAPQQSRPASEAANGGGRGGSGAGPPDSGVSGAHHGWSFSRP